MRSTATVDLDSALPPRRLKSTVRIQTPVTGFSNFQILPQTLYFCCCYFLFTGEEEEAGPDSSEDEEASSSGGIGGGGSGQAAVSGGTGFQILPQTLSFFCSY